MPWPSNTRYLGKPSPRLEAPAKVTGRAKFTTDVAPPGVLFGAILRSKWAAAKIRSVNVDKALAAPGIKAAFAIRDGEFRVRYHGDEIAAVAGTSRDAVLEALELIVVDAEPLPFVVNELEAIKKDAPEVIPGRPNLGEGREKVTSTPGLRVPRLSSRSTARPRSRSIIRWNRTVTSCSGTGTD